MLTQDRQTMSKTGQRKTQPLNQILPGGGSESAFSLEPVLTLPEIIEKARREKLSEGSLKELLVRNGFKKLSKEAVEDILADINSAPTPVPVVVPPTETGHLTPEQHLRQFIDELRANNPEAAARFEETYKAQFGNPGNPDKEAAEQNDEREKLDQSDELRTSQLLAFRRDEDPNSLIGNRWLCRGKQTILQGETGIGKSSLVMQWAICLVLGKSFFGIPAAEPMKVMVIQAENDEGDLAEAFQDIVSTYRGCGHPEFSITGEDLDRLEEKLIFVNRDDVSGGSFVGLLREKIDYHKPDLIFADPLLSYLGGDIMSQEKVSAFLRGLVGPLLRSRNVALIWIHHVGKPGEGKNGEKTAKSGKYAGLGSSEIQNVNRDVITLSRVSGDLFELEFMKRWKRVGIKDKDGNPLSSIKIEHMPDTICWRRNGAKQTATRATEKADKSLDLVWNYIGNNVEAQGKPVPLTQLKAWSRTVNINENHVGDIASRIAAMGENVPEGRSQVFEVKVSNGGKGGPRAKAYTTTPPTQEDLI